jgi:iron(III) transport system permease protein
MGNWRFLQRGWVTLLAGGLHALALAAAAAVPIYAIADAVGTLVSSAGGESSRTLGELHRWPMLLSNTAVVCVTAVLIAVLVGGALSLLVTRTNLPGRRLLVGASLFAACVPVYVSLVALLGFVPAYRLAGSASACGMIYGLVYAPLAGLLLGAAFRAADRELEEQALLDAPASRVLLGVTLPQTSWALVATGMVVLLLVATDFSITDLLTVRTFAEEVYTQFALDHRHAGPLLTGAPMLAVLAALLVAISLRGQWLGAQGSSAPGLPPLRFSLGRWQWPAAVVCLLGGAAAVALPAGSILWHIGSPLGLGAMARGFQHELWTSAILGAGGAAVIVLPAAGLAWHMARRRGLCVLTAAAIVLLMATPAPVVGISLSALLNNAAWGWLYDSPLVVVVGYFVRFLPVAVLLLLPGVQRVPRELEWTARIDGCDWWREHWHVRLPTIAGDLAVVWLVMVVLCFAEIGTTVLLVPPGWETVSVRAFGLLHFGVYRDLAVLALLAIGFTLPPWALLLWAWRRRTFQRCRNAT